MCVCVYDRWRLWLRASSLMGADSIRRRNCSSVLGEPYRTLWLLPDGRRVKNLCPGWVRSLQIYSWLCSRSRSGESLPEMGAVIWWSFVQLEGLFVLKGAARVPCPYAVCYNGRYGTPAGEVDRQILWELCYFLTSLSSLSTSSL